MRPPFAFPQDGRQARAAWNQECGRGMLERVDGSSSAQRRSSNDEGMLMKSSLPVFAILITVAGCDGAPVSPMPAVNPAPRAARRPNPPRQAVVRKVPQKPAFDEKEMIRPLSEIEGFSIRDIRDLPNCLDVFAARAAVPYDGKTSAKYKAMVQEIARKPCRIVLKVVDVSPDYDYAQFEMLTDEGELAVPLLEKAGYLWEHNARVKLQLPINQ